MSFLSGFSLPALPSLNALSDVQIEQPIASPRPILQQGNISLGGIPGTVVGNVPSGAIQQPGTIGDTTSQSDPTPGQFNQELQNSPLVQTGSPAGTTQPTWLGTREISAIIGLIFIAGGLFMFKGTRDVVVTGAKTAAKLDA